MTPEEPVRAAGDDNVPSAWEGLCLQCGEEIEDVLARLGSVLCAECRPPGRVYS